MGVNTYELLASGESSLFSGREVEPESACTRWVVVSNSLLTTHHRADSLPSCFQTRDRLSKTRSRNCVSRHVSFSRTPLSLLGVVARYCERRLVQGAGVSERICFQRSIRHSIILISSLVVFSLSTGACSGEPSAPSFAVIVLTSLACASAPLVDFAHLLQRLQGQQTDHPSASLVDFVQLRRRLFPGHPPHAPRGLQTAEMHFAGNLASFRGPRPLTVLRPLIHAFLCPERGPDSKLRKRSEELGHAACP